jgi:hypothetical protein
VKNMDLSTIWFYLSGQYFLTYGVVASLFTLTAVGIVVYASGCILHSFVKRLYKTVDTAHKDFKKRDNLTIVSTPMMKVSAQKAISDDIKLRFGLIQYRGRYRRGSKTTCKPATVDHFKRLFSENKELVEQMLRSSDIIDVATAKTILQVSGVELLE